MLLRASGSGQFGLPTLSAIPASAGFVLRMAARDLLPGGQLWHFLGFSIAWVLKQLWDIHASALGT